MTADRAALVEKVARVLCWNRSAPACDCRAKGIPCRAPVENLLWPHSEIPAQATAAVSLIRAEVLEEAAKEVEKWPAKHGLYNVASAIRALKEKS